MRLFEGAPYTYRLYNSALLSSGGNLDPVTAWRLCALFEWLGWLDNTKEIKR